MQDARVELALKLRQLADRSSEAELRMALSRSYYSVFHLAKVLSRRVTHENIETEVAKIDPGLATLVGTLKSARSQADYDPGWVAREFGGDPDLFRFDAERRLNDGLLVFRRLLQEVSRTRELSDEDANSRSD